MIDQAEYIDLQFKYNNKHGNGAVEVSYEEAIDYIDKTVAPWIKANEFPCDTFLDAGCRTGYAMEALAKQFPACEVTGIDIVPAFIKMAELRGEAIVGDLQAMPFKDRQFDWVFSCTAIEHCYDMKAAAAEMRRVADFGFFVRTDLEDKKRFDENRSHFTHHNDPSEWVDEFRHPDWWLMTLNVPRYSRIEMAWVRKEYMIDFKKDQDTWR